jgi:hypothetical protein
MAKSGLPESPPRTDIAEVLQPEIQDYLRQFEEATSAAKHVVEKLTDEQLQWKPAPERWSIAECFSHLNVTADKYYPPIDKSMRLARERGLLGNGPFRHGFLMNKFIRMLEPPPRRSFKAPRPFTPRTRAVEDEIPNFFFHQDAIMQRVRDANGLHLARVKIASPISRLLRMTLGQSFALLATHERRHLWQAARVRDEMEREERQEHR